MAIYSQITKYYLFMTQTLPKFQKINSPISPENSAPRLEEKESC